MEETSFLYGFLVGQVALILAGFFLLKHLVFSPKKSDKYTRIIVMASNNNSKDETTKEDAPALISLINEFIQSIYFTSLFDSQLRAFVQIANNLINERIRESNVQGNVALSQLLLEKAPKIKCLNCLTDRKRECYAIEFEWNDAGEITAEGEIGTFGIYLPFSSVVQVQHIALGFELEIDHLLITVIVRSVKIAFEMENTLGHPIQIKDTHKKIESLLKSYILAALQTDVLNKSFMFPIK